MISAKVIADSKNEFGNRITTMVVTFPRIILAEFNTHRMFSRNSASSRAIPFEKMVKSVEENPFIPIAWQKDHKGMQGTEYFISDIDIEANIIKWYAAKERAVTTAKGLYDLGVTKQICNRLLEPFMWHTVIVTATEWENFFALRCPQYEFDEAIFRSKKDTASYIGNVEIGEAEGNIINFKEKGVNRYTAVNKGQAEIHMMALAEAMWDAYNESIPKELKAGEWHIPYNEEIVKLIKEQEYNKYFPYPQDLYTSEIEGTEDEVMSTKYKIHASNMMAARTSYTVVGEDQKPWNFDKYVENGIKLEESEPLHASPLEHCAKAMNNKEFYAHVRGIDSGMAQSYDFDKESRGWSGNFQGFIQYRKTIPNENITK